MSTTAPVTGRVSPGGPAGDPMPRLTLSRRQLVAGAVFLACAIAFFYFVLPQITGLQNTWHRLDQGDLLWLIVAGLLELASFFGYVAVFRIVCLSGAQDHRRIGWRESYQITMASLAATRLFAAAGAGGIALTVWALGRSGMDARMVAVRIIAMTVLLYSVYMGALLIVGTLLFSGVLSGDAAPIVTIVPAALAAVVIVIVGSMALLPADAERRFSHWAAGTGRLQRVGAALVTVPAAAAGGVRTALQIARHRPAVVLAAISWWAFDIATLWACFHAFGSDTPPIGVIVMAYFVGMAGNLLPLPGGVGGVEGGMIAAFVAFDVPFGYATVAVLAYRAFAFWLPTIPGAIAYVQLRGTVRRWREEDARAPLPPASSPPASAAAA